MSLCTRQMFVFFRTGNISQRRDILNDLPYSETRCKNGSNQLISVLMICHEYKDEKLRRLDHLPVTMKICSLLQSSDICVIRCFKIL